MEFLPFLFCVCEKMKYVGEYPVPALKRIPDTIFFSGNYHINLTFFEYGSSYKLKYCNV